MPGLFVSDGAALARQLSVTAWVSAEEIALADPGAAMVQGSRKRSDEDEGSAARSN